MSYLLLKNKATPWTPPPPVMNTVSAALIRNGFSSPFTHLLFTDKINLPCKHQTRQGNGKVPLWSPKEKEQNKQWKKSAPLRTESACRSGRPCFLVLAAPLQRQIKNPSLKIYVDIISLLTNDTLHMNLSTVWTQKPRESRQQMCKTFLPRWRGFHSCGQRSCFQCILSGPACCQSSIYSGLRGT